MPQTNSLPLEKSLASGTIHVRQRSIAPGLSLYLDLVRFLAAVSVVLYHTWSLFDPTTTIKFPGHEAVVVFFVLSGYVIAHAASRPGVTLSIYVQHRAARILPVAWLALVFAGALAALVPELGKEKFLLAPSFANMVFMAESGWWSIGAPLNSSYWSLNYEVWYYIIFAAWFFARQNRWLWLGAAVVLAGPKILMLMPVWLMGAALYFHMPSLRRGAALLIFLTTAGIAAAMCWMDVSDLWRDWLYRVLPPIWRAHYSTQFLYDTVLGIVVSANFAAISSLSPLLDKLRAVEKPIRYLASFTFSLYLFHGPLTDLFLKVWNLNHPLQFYAAMGVCVYLLAQVSEKRTDWYRRQAGRLWTVKRPMFVGIA